MPFRKVTEIWRSWGQHWEMKGLCFIDDRARTLVAASQSGLQSRVAATLSRMGGHKDLAVSGDVYDMVLGYHHMMLHLIR